MRGPHADERTHVLDDPLGQVFEELAQLRGEYTARLAALEEENGRLRARMAVLERPPARRYDGEASVAGVDAPEPDLSRRSLLRRVGAATAIGTGVAVGTSLLGATPASAGTDGDVVLRGTRAVNNAGSRSRRSGQRRTGGLSTFSTNWNQRRLARDANAVFGGVLGTVNPAAAVEGRTQGTGAGVRGWSVGSGGLGLEGEGGRAQLRLVPASTAGAPTGGAHDRGEVFVDSAGTFYQCVAAGRPGTWRKLTAGAPGFAARSGSLNFLAAPVRLLDTRSGAKLAPGATRVVQVTGAAGIPAGAVGVVGNLAVTATENTSGFGGYLTVYPQGVTPPTAANLNWFGANQNLSNTVVVGLNTTNGQMTIHDGVLGGSSPTHVVFDVARFVY